MQGLKAFIPTHMKVSYLNQLLKVGFDTLDMGSFVSPKVMPQMADTPEVMSKLDSPQGTKLLVIVANLRGAAEASELASVDCLGYPLSVSETFQRRNTNRSITEALNELESIKRICDQKGKRLVVYLSMAFGNPYGDPHDNNLVKGFASILVTMGVDVVSVADTIGVATPESAEELMTLITSTWPDLEVGAHLHCKPSEAPALVDAAIRSGVKRMDGALLGYGGCPMAKDELVGNLDTQVILDRLALHGQAVNINSAALSQALLTASEIFPH
jgi:hydroxymethylglutaryl-CoA lyase